jgi:hypothetical protein
MNHTKTQGIRIVLHYIKRRIVLLSCVDQLRAMPAYYLSQQATGANRPTLAFTQRGITGQTVCRLSEIATFAAATVVQVAYAAYRSSIEAFVCASIMRWKQTIAKGFFPISRSVPGILLPLPLAPVIVQLAAKPSDVFLKSFTTAISELGGERIEAGKGNPVFIIRRPTLESLTKIRQVCNPTAPIREGYCQLAALWASVYFHVFIEGFLRTNTYEYHRTESEETEGTGIGKMMETRGSTQSHMPGSTNEIAKKAKTDKKGLVAAGWTKPADEDFDMDPHQMYVAHLDSSVLVAKPSPHPSSNNFGPPSAVPNKPGLLFPYFEGMILSDPKFLRIMASSYIMRILHGNNFDEIKMAFKEFRNDIGTFAHTTTGRVVSHMMYGIHLALQAQALLFLIFDEGYRGFCLLGAEFSVFHQGVWVAPRTASELREDLQEIQTRSMSIALLAAKLATCKDISGDNIIVDMEKMPNRGYLCDVLARVDTSGEGKNSVIEDIEKLLGSILPGSDYKTFKPENITWALRQIASPTTPSYVDWPIYIPRTSWTFLSDPVYKVLACFGPRSLSFRNSNGKEYPIPLTATEKDIFDRKKEKDNLQKIIVYEKPIVQAVQDMHDLQKKLALRMDLTERAGPVRGQVFEKESMDRIVQCLKEVCVQESFAGGKRAPVLKRTYGDAFGKGDLLSEFSL